MPATEHVKSARALWKCGETMTQDVMAQALMAHLLDGVDAVQMIKTSGRGIEHVI